MWWWWLEVRDVGGNGINDGDDVYGCDGVGVNSTVGSNGGGPLAEVLFEVVLVAVDVMVVLVVSFSVHVLVLVI